MPGMPKCPHSGNGRREQRGKTNICIEAEDGVSLLLKVVKGTKKVRRIYQCATILCTKYNVFECDRVCVGACVEKVLDSLAINGTVIFNEGSDLQTRALL